VNIAKEYDTPDWSPDKAQQEMEQALTALNNQVDGVYAANDGMAGGAIAAMKAAGLNPLPPVTGQDAELAAIQRILAHEQYMTIYKAIRPEAEVAAELAFDLCQGQPPAATRFNSWVDNAKIEVPAILLKPIGVTRDNIKNTVVADQFWSIEQICTPGKSWGWSAITARASLYSSSASPASIAMTRVSIFFEGQARTIGGPQDVVRLGIETVYQDLALCDNLDVVANLYLGREQRARQARLLSVVDEITMEKHTLDVLRGLSVKLPNIRAKISALSDCFARRIRLTWTRVI